MSNNLHVYLSVVPSPRDIESFFTTLGFGYSHLWASNDDVEPDCQFWNWHQAPISDGGIELLYFDSAFKDNVRFSEYLSSVVIRGGLKVSAIDLSMIDITASLLLNRYGGVIHNPQRIDRKFASVYLCGVNHPRSRSAH